MPVAQRVLGENNELTLAMRMNRRAALYDAGATLDDLREAVTTLEDTQRYARRVFGGAHPIDSGHGGLFAERAGDEALAAREGDDGERRRAARRDEGDDRREQTGPGGNFWMLQPAPRLALSPYSSAIIAEPRCATGIDDFATERFDLRVPDAFDGALAGLAAGFLAAGFAAGLRLRWPRDGAYVRRGVETSWPWATWPWPRASWPWARRPSSGSSSAPP